MSGFVSPLCMHAEGASERAEHRASKEGDASAAASKVDEITSGLMPHAVNFWARAAHRVVATVHMAVAIEIACGGGVNRGVNRAGIGA